jgi:hypothetical protein
MVRLKEGKEGSLGSWLDVVLRLGASCAGHVAADDVHQHLPGLPDGQNQGGNRGQEAPDHGDDHPHGEVALGEHTGGDGQQGPEDDHDQGQGAAGPVGPVQGLGQGLGAALVILNLRGGEGGGRRSVSWRHG